jgi:putative FmdB family regulatory protein
MPIYEYLAERCDRTPSCSRRKEHLQGLKEEALSACRECGAPMRRVMSSFAARSGEVGASSPEPTGLNVTGIPAPSSMPTGEGCGGHEH